MRESVTDGLTGIAIDAASPAADVHRAGWEAGFDVHAKGQHGDSVTDVDIEAERAIRSFIISRRPHDSIIGEELGFFCELMAAVRDVRRSSSPAP